jgi:hypothetical protein
MRSVDVYVDDEQCRKVPITIHQPSRAVLRRAD